MHQDAHTFVRDYFHCTNVKPVQYGTLYQVMVTLKWSQYLVDYLKTHILPANISQARKRAIEIEAWEYALIGNQLYHRGKDKQL